MTSKSRTIATYEAIKHDILDGCYLPDQKLRIDALSASLRVSPGAVREALSRLTSDGLVNMEPQKGFMAGSVSAADLRDLTEVRIDVELRCLASAIKDGTLSWEANLLSVHHRLARTPKLTGAGGSARLNDAWSELHDAFHAALASGCANSWWLRLRAQLFVQAERYRRLLVPGGEEFERDIDREHRAIMDAALARDPHAACNLLAKYLRKTADTLLSDKVRLKNGARLSGEATQN